MAIPNIAHFVWGLREEPEPFHLVHYLCLESCRRVHRPAQMVVHCRQPPFGRYWDAIAQHVTLAPVGLVPEVLDADFDECLAPSRYRYAHHADFLRLDALIEAGGLYADLDTLFVQPLPDELTAATFVIGREDDVYDVRTGALRPSLCNALLLSEPRATFAVLWRRLMSSALDGSWSNHSTLLPHELSVRLPEAVRVEPRRSFYRFGPSRQGIGALLERLDVDIAGILSVHLWAHLWWDEDRRDFSHFHSGLLTEHHIRTVDTTYSVLAREFLPGLDR